MKYIIYTIVLALTWAHIAPQIMSYKKHYDFAQTMTSCELVTIWSWSELRVITGLRGCMHISPTKE